MEPEVDGEKVNVKSEPFSARTVITPLLASDLVAPSLTPAARDN